MAQARRQIDLWDPFVYVSYLQQGSDYRGGSIMTHLAQTLVVRSAYSLGSRAAGLTAAVKKAVADPDQPVTGINPAPPA